MTKDELLKIASDVNKQPKDPSEKFFISAFNKKAPRKVGANNGENAFRERNISLETKNTRLTKRIEELEEELAWCMNELFEWHPLLQRVPYLETLEQYRGL